MLTRNFFFQNLEEIELIEEHVIAWVKLFPGFLVSSSLQVKVDPATNRNHQHQSLSSQTGVLRITCLINVFEGGIRTVTLVYGNNVAAEITG